MNNPVKKVSFDFDDTLEFGDIQDFAKELMDIGIEVHITTSRYENLDDYLPTIFPDGHKELFRVAEKLKVPRDHIHFTNFQNKSTFIKGQDFIWHLDDDFMEIKDINRTTKTKGIYVLGNDWKHDCKKLLNLTNGEQSNQI